MGNTDPESTVPSAAPGRGGAGLRPAGAGAGQGRELDDVELIVEPDEEAASRAAAAFIADVVRSGGHVALSGGSTRPTYERLARLAPNWSGVTLWWADERCVPVEDPRSNYRLVRESLLDGLAAPPREVQRVRCERPPEDAAAAYDDALAGVTLDLAFLGIGPDGHTASLFPNAPGLEERERRALAVEAGMEPLVPRVTLTLPVLRDAAVALFLVTGERKAEAVARAFAAEPDAATPASLVRARRTVAVLDEAAAATLSR